MFGQFTRRHELSSYLVLCFGLSWGGVLAVFAFKRFQLNAFTPDDFPIIILFMLLGPSIGGLLVVSARRDDAWRQLFQAMARWRVAPRWYAMALLTVPVLLLAILMPLAAALSPAFAPDFRIEGLLIGIIAGGMEEIGWTGFVTPVLLKKFDWLRAGLLLGLVWALWHMPADLVGNFNTMGARWLLWYGIFWLLPLTAYRILMTWVYANTHSVLVAQLMHASYTGWLYTLSPTAAFEQNLMWQMLFAIGLWLFVLTVFVRASADGSRRHGGARRNRSTSRARQ